MTSDTSKAFEAAFQLRSVLEPAEKKARRSTHSAVADDEPPTGDIASASDCDDGDAESDTGSCGD